MGKEWNRIQGYADTYYASREGYKVARNRQDANKIYLFIMVVLFVVGPFIIGMTQLDILGIIMTAFGLLGIVAYLIGQRRR